MAYNGWSNYETWNVALWLDNEPGSYNEMREAAEDNRDDSHALAKFIEVYVTDQAPDLGASMFADLLGAALGGVDWREIAEHYLSDLEPEEEEEEVDDAIHP